MANPYQSLPTTAFWRSAVAERTTTGMANIWHSKWSISPQSSICTFGSCFAQHISKALLKNGFSWFNGEPAPPLLFRGVAKRFSYNVFSARTGNIYTTSQLHQWLRWALTDEPIPDEAWQNDRGHFIDPFRPKIEPDGFRDMGELDQSRQQTLAALRRCVEQSDLFIFTLGLTESWFHHSGYEYALCPGTAAGTFDPKLHIFRNQTTTEVKDQLEQAIKLLHKHNPKLNVLLTVSPVPLVATSSEHHVLPATIYSKSVLRAVAGECAQGSEHVDYFPSFELISSHPFAGNYYQDNLRNVTPQGVSHVMKHFFQGIGHSETPVEKASTATTEISDDVVCEEEILDAFRKNS